MKLRTTPRDLFVLLAIVAGSFATASESAAVKDHVLFVGSDFLVVRGGHEQPIISAGNRTVVVMDGSRPRELALRSLPDIRIHRGLKLTCLTAAIDKLEAVLSSDAINAEQMESTMNSIALSMAADKDRDRAYGKMHDEDVGRGSVGSVLNPHVMKVIFEEADGKQVDANNRYLQAESLRTQESYFLHDQIDTHGAAVASAGDEVEITPDISGGTVGLSVTGQQPRVVKKQNGSKAIPRSIVDAGGGRSDHLDLSFVVSAPKSFDAAYVVITTEFTVPKSNEVFRRILTQAIGHVDAAPRKVSVYETGYPEGFHLRTYVISIYANDQEVATNLSESQLAMTRDEAYQYIVADYLTAHKGQSLPPAAVLMAPRSEVAAAFHGPGSNEPVYVTVNESGTVTGISTARASNRMPDGEVAAALQNFRFIPALDKGVPARGRAKLILSDFLRY